MRTPCPRCGGFLQLEHDIYGRVVTCINCGLSREFEPPAQYDAAAEASQNRSDGQKFGPAAVRTHYRDPRKLRGYRQAYEQKKRASA